MPENEFHREEPKPYRQFLSMYYRACQKLLLSAAYLITSIFTTLRITGKENLKDLPTGPLLIVANHKSSLDPLLVGMCFPFFSHIYPLRFISKDEFFSNFLNRFLFTSLGAYPAYSGQGLEKSLSTPRHILSEGGTVVFFPEGKRVYTEGIGEAKIGAALLAKDFPEMTIVPIAIAGLHKLGRWGILYPRLKLEVRIGVPYKSSQILSEGSLDVTREGLMKKIKELYFQ